MPLQYRIDIVQALKDAGYNTNRIRKEKIMSESTMTKIRNGDGIGWENIETICKLLNCQPGDLIEFVNESD